MYKEHKAYHVVSAFVAENQITLGEICVDEKSNEITAVPELLDLLYIDNAIITANSMSCQKKIVQKIVDNNGDLKKISIIYLKIPRIFLMNLQKDAIKPALPKKDTAELKNANIFFALTLIGFKIVFKFECFEENCTFADK